MQVSYFVPDDVVSEVLEGEAVVLHLGTGKYFSLNASGTRMWTLLGQTGDMELTLRELATEFPTAAPADLRTDLRTLVGELLSLGLLARETRHGR